MSIPYPTDVSLPIKNHKKKLKNNSLSFYFYTFQRHSKEPTDPEPLIVSAGTRYLYCNSKL